jgi:hypothetical protein
VKLESLLFIISPTQLLVVPRILRAKRMGRSANLNFIQIFHTMIQIVKRQL